MDTATFGLAWLVAAVALALHVADEASHDFLSWYNPRALRIRRALRGFPIPPTFTFWPWLLGLIAGVLVLCGLTPFAYRGAGWLRPVAYVLAGIHIGNGLLHVGGSILARRPVPGVWTAPVLLVAGLWLAYAAAHVR
jgi:hypothetical protein